MNEPLQGDAFRNAATRLFKQAKIALLVFALACPVVGWFVGGVWGLIIATVAGCALSALFAVAISLLFVLSQDGA